MKLTASNNNLCRCRSSASDQCLDLNMICRSVRVLLIRDSQGLCCSQVMSMLGRVDIVDMSLPNGTKVAILVCVGDDNCLRDRRNSGSVCLVLRVQANRSGRVLGM